MSNAAQQVPIAVSPATASVAHNGSTQQFTCNIGYIKWQVSGDANGVSVDLTGSSISSSGLLTTGPNTGTCYVFARRYDGERSAPAVVTVT